MAAGSSNSVVSEALRAYHSCLKDSTTKEQVTSSSTLAELGCPAGLLRKLVYKTPSLTGSLQVDGGRIFAPTCEDGYELKLCYDTLLFAPCLLIECSFFDVKGPQKLLYLIVVVEFHFSKGATKPLTDFRYTERNVPSTSSAHTDTDRADGDVSSARIEFTARGCTSAGFNISRETEARFGEDERTIFAVMKSLLNPPKPQRVSFTIHNTVSAHGELDETKELDHTKSEEEKDMNNIWNLYDPIEELREIHSMLPGGSGPLLPSVGSGIEEYACFPSLSQLELAGQKNYRPYIDFLSTEFSPRFQMDKGSPMCPLKSRDTFRSLREFEVANLIASVGLHRESYTNLLLWAGAKHSASLFSVNNIPVIAMKFDSTFHALGSRKSGQMRLPQGLECRMVIANMTFTAFREEEITCLDKADAFFMVTSHTLEKVLHLVDNGRRYDVSNIEPHRNSFVLNSVIETLEGFPDLPKDWHAIALNQTHDTIQEIDVVAGIQAHDDPVISERIKKEALQWMHTYMPWDIKQKELLDSIHRSKGRFTLCTGIAGTGKSTLQLVLAIFFIKLGGRAILTAMSNSSADHLARSLKEMSEEIQGLKLRIYRIYAASKSTPLRQMTAENVRHRKAGHTGGNVATLDTFNFAIKNPKKQVEAWDYSIEAGILDELEKKELSFVTALHPSRPRKVDAWEVLRKHFEAAKAGTFSWKNRMLVEEYTYSYEACKGHLLALADAIITCNGNMRANEVRSWQNAARDHPEIEVRALAVLVDESASEAEMNIWNTLGSLHREPDLVVLVGDPFQLGPMNTSSVRPRYNMFLERASVSLMRRLIRQGFPYINLEEQRRMHPCLLHFPSQEFYPGELRSAPEMDKTLEEVEPGLAAVLLRILSENFGHNLDTEPRDRAMGDEIARLAYLNLGEAKISRSNDGSIAVPNHIDIFFKHVFPHLQKHFGARMREEFMLVCGYSETRRCYRTKINQLQSLQMLKDEHYFDVSTIDAAQGRQKKMICVDACLLKAEDTGFVSVPGRANVALTRATSVLWVLGGPLSERVVEYTPYGDCYRSPWAKLKSKLAARGQVHLHSR